MSIKEHTDKLQAELSACGKDPLIETPRKKKCYAVIGRFLFGDEDTCHVVWADSQGDAVEHWEHRMKEEDSDNENELTITQILESYTQIKY